MEGSYVIGDLRPSVYRLGFFIYLHSTQCTALFLLTSTFGFPLHATCLIILDFAIFSR